MKIFDKFKLDMTLNNFLLIVSLYMGYVLNIKFVKEFIFKFQITDVRSFFCFVLGFVIIPIPIYVLLNIFSFKKLVKPLSIILIIISSVTNFMMLNNGIVIDSDMIRNVFETNTREALDLISIRQLFYIFLTGILPSILIYKINIKYDTFFKNIKKRIIYVLCALIFTLAYVAAFYKVLAPFGRNNNKIQRNYNVGNYINGTYEYLAQKAKANKKFKILDENVQNAEWEDNITDVIVLIVGETARANNFSLLGYDKKTNPNLEKIENLVYSKAIACGTATAKSLPCMFSPYDRKEVNIDDARNEENLLDFFVKAGWKVIWKDNDDGCKGVCNRVENYMMKDSKDSKHCFGDYCHDESLFEGLEGILNNIQPKQKTLIVLHMMGSHGPTYYKRYPNEFRKFQPTCDTADIQKCTQEELINTYDNTILYTDYVISSVINTVKKYKNFESSVVYLSDHGESLGENGVYLHGLPYSIAPHYQTEVPLIIWLSDNIIEYDHFDFDCIDKFFKNDNALSHDNFFHSMLGIGEIDSMLYKKEYDFFNNCRKEKLDFMKR